MSWVIPAWAAICKMPGFTNLGAPLPDPPAGYPLRNICLSIPDAPEYRQALWGQIWQMGQEDFWEKEAPDDERNIAVAQLWRDLLNSQYDDYLSGVDCNPTEGCKVYPNTAAFISYYPNDPRYTPDYTPPGYTLPPWYISTGNILTEPVGAESGDILNTIARFPTGTLPDILPPDGLPRFRVWVNGEGVVRLKVRMIAAGSLLQTTVDDDILTIAFTDVNLDIISVPAETNNEVVLDIDVSGPGNHWIDGIIVTWINDQFPFVFQGGGLVSVELCGPQPGQEEGFVLPSFTIDRSGDSIRLLADGVPVSTVDISDKVDDTGDTMVGTLNVHSGENKDANFGSISQGVDIVVNKSTWANYLYSRGSSLQIQHTPSSNFIKLDDEGWRWYMSGLRRSQIDDQGRHLANETIYINKVSSTNAWRNAARVEASWADSTDATRRGTMALGVYKQDAVQVAMTASADDSGEPKLSFRGEAPIVRPTLTGNVSQETYDLAQALDDLGLVDNQFTLV